MQNSNGKKILIGVIIIVVVALLAAWILSRQGLIGNNTAAVGELATTTEPVTTSSATLTVNDQFPGNIIYVSEVTLPQPGWVVIRRDNNGTLGDIIGVGYFDTSVHVGEVDLAQATNDGEHYVGVLYTDNGDYRFTTTADKPLLGADGNPIMSSFLITRDLPERKG